MSNENKTIFVATTISVRSVRGWFNFLKRARLRTGVDLHRVDAAADALATPKDNRNRVARLAEAGVARELDRLARDLLSAVHHLDEIRNRAARQDAHFRRLVVVRDRQNRTVRAVLADQPRRRARLRHHDNQRRTERKGRWLLTTTNAIEQQQNRKTKKP